MKIIILMTSLLVVFTASAKEEKRNPANSQQPFEVKTIRNGEVANDFAYYSKIIDRKNKILCYTVMPVAQTSTGTAISCIKVDKIEE